MIDAKHEIEARVKTEEWSDGGGGDGEEKGAEDQCSSPSSVSASPLICGNVWSRSSIIIRWTLTIKISQVVAWGARERQSSNHHGFTPLMMGRELIYPGEKQIKALLSPALHHTIAYINILSWAIQVSEGLVHLHLHKGPALHAAAPACTLSPPLLMSACCPLFHLPVFLFFTLLTTSPSSSSVSLAPVWYSSSPALLRLNSHCLLSALSLSISSC